MHMYEGLRFSFSEMDKELDNMHRLSSGFVTLESSARIIPALRRDLANFRSAPAESSTVWEIRKDDPIQTNPSNGAYEPGERRGGLNVLGRVCGKWQIRLPKEVKKRFSQSKDFILFGLASTEISIWEVNERQEKEIARWTIEIGDATSPGCHFHTQITLDDEDNKFPSTLSVPRLPGLLHTPMDALEYLLGELFQDEWYRNASKGTNVVNAWAACQKNRIVNLLKWQTERLLNTGGSPWTMLKRQKPTIGMLMGEN